MRSMTITEFGLGGDYRERAVKAKKGRNKDLRAGSVGGAKEQANRIASGSSEVMVKITGFGKGAGHIQSHLDYISRNGKVELETSQGETLTGKQEIKEFFDDWKQEFSDSKRQKNQRDTMHMVLSMPEHVEPEAVRLAVREFAKKEFGSNHDYVFALHTDEPHPHCHLSVKMRGFDGTRLNPRKADLQAWREGFAEQLRAVGVAAEATPRRSRGVVRKPERQVLRHMEQGDEKRAPRVPRVKAEMVKQVAAELVNEQQGQKAQAKPWEAAIEKTQRQVRSAWLDAANVIEHGVPRITFNKEEAKNERPNYDQLTDREIAARQRRYAAVHQPDAEKHGQRTPAQTLASVRNLSSLNVVQHTGSSQMLLSSNALDRLGKWTRPDFEMRRSGAGHSANGAAERGSGVSQEDRTLLANKMRGFVAAMPEVETARQAMRRELVERFAVDRAQEAKKGPEQAGPKGGKGVER